jgi:predicted ATPase
MRSGDDSYLFIATTQLNLGGPKAVQDKTQYSQIAKYNLIAGKKAIEMSQFSSAFNYFDNGITFLRKKHWQNEYELSLELYNLAAKCALAIKDTTSLTMIFDAVSRNARKPEDALDASYVTMLMMSHTSLSNSVEYGFKMLSGLDVVISPSATREVVLKQIHQTQEMLNGIPDETILSYHITVDYNKGMAMKLLAKMISSINQCNPSLAPLVIIKLVRLTIEHGLVS